MGAELFHAEDRQTDMTKLIVALRNFANAPNNGLHEPRIDATIFHGNKHHV
jgi:hypothetical protein